MRRVWLILAFLAVGLVSSCGTFAVMTYRGMFETPPGALLAHMPGGPWDEVSAAYDARVQSRFPLGSSEAALVRDLAAQRYRPTWPDQLEPGQRGAEVSWASFPCSMHASVTWQADAAGRLTAVNGRYGERGCL